MPHHHAPWTRRWPRFWSDALLRLLLPSHCALCGEDCDGVVCAPCRDHFCLAVTNRCARCANPLPAACTGTCNVCQSYPPSYDATIFAVDYAPPLDHLVLQLKFSARLPLAPWF